MKKASDSRVGTFPIPRTLLTAAAAWEAAAVAASGAAAAAESSASHGAWGSEALVLG